MEATDSGSSSEDVPRAKAGDSDVGAITIHVSAEQEIGSFYDLYTKGRRYGILLMVSIASIMVPFSDTIYLPALAEVQTDLATTQSLVAASVAIYMFMVGIASLAWGPASDRYGRKSNYILASFLFLASSIVCIFAPSIAVLLAFRALQGAAVAAFFSVGNGVIADVFPPEQRGTASGMFMIPLLVGPIIGPLLGGGLSEAFGWRSTFICLVVFAGAVILPMIFFLLPETLQYTELQKLKERDPLAAASMKEADSIDSNPPVFQAPWSPLRYLLEPGIAPHAVVALVTFGTFFASLTEFPIAISKPPYSFPISLIGVMYLPQGIGGLLASPVAGRLSDKAAAAHPDAPESRLVFSTLAALVIMPPALLLYGWSLHYKVSIAAALIGQFFIGVACSSYLPGIFGYLSALKQSAAGAASAAVQTTMFVSAGVLILASSVAVVDIGMGPFFSILAGIQAVCALFAFVIIMAKRRASQGRKDVAAQKQEQEREDKQQAV